MTTPTTTCRRLPAEEHYGQDWRIHDIAPDFVLEDVWALPTPGDADGFEVLLEQVAGADAHHHPSLVVRTLMSIRWRLGAVLGWDDDDDGLDRRAASLRHRLPADLSDGETGPETPDTPFRPVYRTDDEFVAELANRTVHALGHYGWVPAPGGGYRGQLAVLVKPDGLLGHAYLAGIRPIRRWLVYPALMRSVAREWGTRAEVRAWPDRTTPPRLRWY